MGDIRPLKQEIKMPTVRQSEMYQRIRAARKRVGFTQDAVATELGVDRTAVTQWEARKPERRTRPALEHLERFAALTRTPVWWLLSDEVDVLEPWPEIVSERTEAAAPRGVGVRRFWEQAALRAQELRPDLWDESIWAPPGPAWMHPILPDALTARCAVRWVQAYRVDMARITALATSLLGFERLQGTEIPRKVVLVWRPSGNALSQQEQTYRHDVDRVHNGSQALCERLGVRYLIVETVDEAAQYLTQLL